MKWIIASDIHGSAYWCEELMQAFKREKADRMLLLGDLLYHGPRNDLPKDYDPRRVTAMLNEHKQNILCVRGNCDAEVDQMVLEFPIMSDSLQIALHERMIFATHGHLAGEDNPPEQLQKGDILLNGHTHVPACQIYDKFVYLNPGSVSIPKEDSKNAYLTLEEDVFLWKTMDGTVYMEWKASK